MAAHSNLGASSAHRWMACPGSVALIASLPAKDDETSYAAEGTKAHELAELCLLQGMDAVDLPDTPEWAGYPEDMRFYVQQYLDQVRAIHAEVGGEMLVEQRVSYAEWVPGGFGTSDVIIIADDEIVAIDLKYGLGVRVDAPGNPQAMLYLLGAYAEHELSHDFEKATGIIIQPRLDHYSSTTLNIDELMAFGREAGFCAEMALAPDAPLNPGEAQCRFCDAKAVCRARAERNLETAKVEFAPAETPAPATLSLDEIAELLPKLADLKAWAKDIEEYALQLAVTGASIPYHKVVEGRSMRKWRPGAEEALADHPEADRLFARKLVGIGQAEKVLGKRSETIEAQTEKGRGKPTLVAKSDKRPEMQGTESAKADFAD